MNITILTLGWRGDVEPFVALGKGLKRAGHEVALCTSVSFEKMVTRHGLTYAYVNDELLKLAGTRQPRFTMEKRANPFRLIRQVRPIIRQTLDEQWAAAQGSEAILYHPKALGGYHIAEKLRIPALLGLPIPLITPTRAFRIPLFAGINLGGYFNKLTHKVMLRLLAAPYRGVINRWRTEMLGMPRMPLLVNDYAGTSERPFPVLYGYSPHVVPSPDDWPETTKASGYWFLDPPTEWQPPPDLLRFLDRGNPPVYAGFGSAAGLHPEKLANVVIAALVQAGQRGVIATGWGGLAPPNLPGDIFQLEAAPHAWLLPRMAAVVHHGGAGTTAAGLRAGKPSIICPFLGDQTFWGTRVHSLGAGPTPIPQNKLTVANLSRAIRLAVTDTHMHRHAARLGENIRAENGLGVAVDFISSCLGLAEVPDP